MNNYQTDTTIVIDSIDQKSSLKTRSYTVGGNIVYTEPIKKYGQISINYAPSFTKTTSNKHTDNYDVLTDSYTLQDTALSNQFNNSFSQQKFSFFIAECRVEL